MSGATHCGPGRRRLLAVDAAPVALGRSARASTEGTAGGSAGSPSPSASAGGIAVDEFS